MFAKCNVVCFCGKITSGENLLDGCLDWRSREALGLLLQHLLRVLQHRVLDDLLPHDVLEIRKELVRYALLPVDLVNGAATDLGDQCAEGLRVSTSCQMGGRQFNPVGDRARCQ